MEGFEYGADDYVVKPFSTREVLLRVRAQLARAGGATPGVGEAPRAELDAVEAEWLDVVEALERESAQAAKPALVS